MNKNFNVPLYYRKNWRNYNNLSSIKELKFTKNNYFLKY